MGNNRFETEAKKPRTTADQLADLKEEVGRGKEFSEKLANDKELANSFPRVEAVMDGVKFMGIRMTHFHDREHKMLTVMGYKSHELIKSINGQKPGAESMGDIKKLVNQEVKGMRILVLREGKNIELKA